MQSLAMLGKRKSDRRRILLVIGEKRDRSSKVKFATVLQEAQRQNVLIYWLTYSPFLEPFTAKPKTVKSKDPAKDGELLPPDMAPGNLLSVFTELAHQGKPDNSVQLTRATGGRSIGFLKQEALEEAIQAIASEVHRQYIVSFTPPPSKAGEYHNIRIEVKGHPELDGADARRLLVDALGADYRQDNLRRPVPSKVDGVFGDPPAPIVVERFAGIRIYVKPWEVAAGDVHAYAVAALEHQRRRIHFDGELLGLPGFSNSALAGFFA